MSNLEQFETAQDQGVNEEARAPMRTLTAEELHEIVGGPDIQNGGAIGLTASTVSTAG